MSVAMGGVLLDPFVLPPLAPTPFGLSLSKPCSFRAPPLLPARSPWACRRVSWFMRRLPLPFGLSLSKPGLFRALRLLPGRRF